MIHDRRMLESIEPFIAGHLKENKSQDELFNEWIRENCFDIHDADTVLYFTALIPLIERRLLIC